jgi:pimeloyl-ACP methyl ester carboxylesterase
LSTINLKTKGFTDIPRVELLEYYAKEIDQSSFIKFNGFEIHIRDNQVKNKPILIGLHGICDSLHTWNPWAKYLQEHFRFIRIDLPYFGLSKKNNNLELSEDYYNTFLDQLINHLNLKKVNLLGHSLGAFIAWKYAIHRPERVEKLILLAPPGYPQAAPKVISLSTTPLIKQLALLWTPKFILPPILNNLFFDNSNISQDMINRYYNMMMCEGNRKQYADIFSFMIKHAGKEHLDMNQLNLPVLILWGKKDLWVPSRKAAPYFKEKLPHAKIVLYEKMRHMPQYEETVNTLNQLFLFFDLPVVT